MVSYQALKEICEKLDFHTQYGMVLQRCREDFAQIPVMCSK